jgi:glutamate-1-semialdehyde 2,1-aminomutase
MSAADSRHAPKGLTKAIRRAARHERDGAPSPLEVTLAERVTKLMPSLERVRFVSSGTEAAMRRCASRGGDETRSLHQVSGLLSRPRRRVSRAGRFGRADVRPARQPRRDERGSTDTLVASHNDLASVQALFDANTNAIAAVIVEPIAGNMGVSRRRRDFSKACGRCATRTARC